MLHINLFARVTAKLSTIWTTKLPDRESQLKTRRQENKKY